MICFNEKMFLLKINFCFVLKTSISLPVLFSEAKKEKGKFVKLKEIPQ